MELYNYFRSSASYRVRIALALKQLDYDYKSVHLQKNEQLAESFSAVQASRLVPLLHDGDVWLSQSMAILEYLDETHPEPPLLPRDAYLRARVRDFKDQIVADIHPLNNTSTLARLRSQFGADDKAIASWYEHWIVRGFQVLEQMLPSGGSFCVGDAITLADIVLVPQVTNARRYPQIDLQQFPNILRIDTALRKIDAFHRAAPDQQPEAKEPVT